MRRITIEIEDENITDVQAINCVKKTIEKGRISKSARGILHYQYVTTFKSGIRVINDLTKARHYEFFSVDKYGEG